jgi:hypothetical protein
VDDVDDVFHADGPQQAVAVVHYGHLDDVVAAHEARHLFLVGVGVDGLHVVAANGADGRAGIGGDEPVQRHHAHQVVVVVEDVQIEGVVAGGRLADVLDRLRDRGMLAHGDDVRRHEPARGVLGVLEELLHLLGFLLLHEVEDLVRLLLGQLLDDLDHVIGRHAVEDARDLVLVERAHELQQGGIVELREHGARLLRAEEAEDVHLVGLRQLADGARDVGRMRVLEESGEPVVPAAFQQLPDRLGEALFHGRALPLRQSRARRGGRRRRGAGRRGPRGGGRRTLERGHAGFERAGVGAQAPAPQPQRHARHDEAGRQRQEDERRHRHVVVYPEQETDPRRLRILQREDGHGGGHDGDDQISESHVSSSRPAGSG